MPFLALLNYKKNKKSARKMQELNHTPEGIEPSSL